MLKNLSHKLFPFGISLAIFTSCASSTLNWKGDMSQHVASYMSSFDKFRKEVCKPETEEKFDSDLLAYRGQGYWIPELDDDVDVETIKLLLPQMEKKLEWIKTQKERVQKKGIPKQKVTEKIRKDLEKLLQYKKYELEEDEKKKIASRSASLKELEKLKKSYETLVSEVPFLTNFQFPVDHLKNRKVYDSYKGKEDVESVKISNYAFLYRKLLEDGAYNKNRTGSDIYLRTTMDTLYFEIRDHGFYLSEDARYDFDFILGKIDSELARGKDRILERLTEWEERTQRTYDFYKSLTLPENQVQAVKGDKNSTPNRQLILEHNRATDKLKEFVYSKQADVYKYWLNQPELLRAIFVIETILMNEVGGVDGDEALERMDVARVVMNRLDKPQYLSIGKKEFIWPYLKKITSDYHLKNEKFLNALFKQGEFSFTYYYMSGVSKIFCPDLSKKAKKLREKNIEIALKVLKEDDSSFKATRYFSRASMIGRIHMDSVWDDYQPYPERPGLLAEGQRKLLGAFQKSAYTFLYSFKDPEQETYQVLEIDGKVYALSDKNGLKVFYSYRNPHYFRYFSKIEMKP